MHASSIIVKPEKRNISIEEKEEHLNLRQLVDDCLAKNQLKCAEFFSDKLVTLGGGLVDDVYTLGLIYYRQGQHHRMIHLFQQNKFLADPKQEMIFGQSPSKQSMHPRFLLLAMQGLYEAKAYEDGLQLTSQTDDNEAYKMIKKCCQYSMSDEGAYEMDYCSSLCLVRGKIWEAMDHQDYAIRWYRWALHHDVKNFEAFSRLVDRRMITRTEEMELLAKLKERACALTKTGWLYTFYKSMLEQFDYGIRPIGEEKEKMTVNEFKKYKLEENDQVLAIQAHTHYNLNAFEQCYQITSKIIQRSPFNEHVLAPHICSLVELKNKADLHYLAHQLANRYPEKPISWFAVGAYYYLVEKFDIARRHFNRATDLDQHFSPAWIGFGHSFGYQDASDQAVAAYRTANRLFPGSHIPLVCIGMEYVRTQNLPLAQLFFDRAKQICAYDPLIYNELGIIAYKNQNYEQAAKLLMQALQYCSNLSVEMREPITYNLGHALRQLGKYDKALDVYRDALDLDPQNPKILTAIAFTYLLQQKYDESIGFCHRSLALLPTDSFAVDVLRHALEDNISSKHRM